MAKLGTVRNRKSGEGLKEIAKDRSKLAALGNMGGRVKPEHFDEMIAIMERSGLTPGRLPEYIVLLHRMYPNLDSPFVCMPVKRGRIDEFLTAAFGAKKAVMLLAQKAKELFNRG